MKFKLTIFLILFFFSRYANSQKKTDTIAILKKEVLKTELSLRHSNDSLLDVAVLLKQKNELLETTITSNNHIFNGISSFLTAITIILAIVSILLVIFIPLLNYIMVIRPSKKMKNRIESIDQEIENKFDLFYKNYENKKFKLILNELKENNNSKDLVSFMNTTNYKNFDNEDFDLIIDFLKKNIETEDLYSLHSILNFKPNNSSTLFYKETFEFKKNQNYPFALRYLVNQGEHSYFPFLKNQIINSQNGHTLMLDILECAEYYYLNSKIELKKNIAKSIIEKYFNDQEICLALKSKELPKKTENPFSCFRSNLYENTVYEKNSFIKETEYYNLFLKDIIKSPPSFLTC